MRTDRPEPRTVDEYIAGFPADTRKLLQQMRRTIRKAAPDAEETISYRIPAFTFHGALIYFAAYERHIGLYPAPSGSAAFERRLAAYRSGKSTIRFPLDEPLPLDLIAEVVKLRAKANLDKVQSKSKPKRK